jgi:hypothetical protein
MEIWLIFSSMLIGIWIYLFCKLRQNIKLHQQELERSHAQLQEKASENIQLKEELLKFKSVKDKLKENLEKYQHENKRLQEVARKKRKERSDAGKHREVPSGNKRTGKPKGAKGGGLKNPDLKEIDYTREHYLEKCPKCKNSLKDVNPFGYCNHYIRDFEKLKRGLQLVYIRHVIYRYKCPHCGKIVSKYFGKLKNARYGIGLIAFVLYERVERGGSWEGIRSTINRIVHAPECVPTIAAFIEWIKKYEDEMRTIYDAFLKAIKSSPFAHVDETGLPLDGKNWWLWCIVATEVVLYLPSDTRGSEAIKDIFHEYKGILLSDFWTAYNKLDAEQQKCLEHVVRELRKISLKELETRDKAAKQLEQDTKVKEQESSPLTTTPKKRGRPAKQPAPLSEEDRRKLEQKKAQCEKASQQATKFVDFFKNAWNKKGHPMSVFTPIDKRMRTAEAEILLKALIEEIKAEGPANADIERLIERFEKYGPCLFTYLDHPDVMPDNNAVEREIRPFVVQRKVSGKFISPEVMNMYAKHLSLYRTCKRNRVNYEDVIIPFLKGDTDNVLILLGLKPVKPPPVIIG